MTCFASSMWCRSSCWAGSFIPINRSDGEQERVLTGGMVHHVVSRIALKSTRGQRAYGDRVPSETVQELRLRIFALAQQVSRYNQAVSSRWIQVGVCGRERPSQNQLLEIVAHPEPLTQGNSPAYS